MTSTNSSPTCGRPASRSSRARNRTRTASSRGSSTRTATRWSSGSRSSGTRRTRRAEPSRRARPRPRDNVEKSGPTALAGGEMINEVRLRGVEPEDLPIFYEHQLDPDAARMAGFPSRDRAAFDAHWANNVLGNPAAVTQTILVDGRIAGNIGSWPQDGLRLVGY